jgi:hypothetical protein
LHSLFHYGDNIIEIKLGRFFVEFLDKLVLVIINEKYLRDIALLSREAEKRGSEREARK